MQEKKAAVNAAIEKYLACFEKVLYEDDKTFLVNMRKKNIPEEEIEKYRYWEWTQGVGLFGVWKLFRETKDQRYLDILTAYYERQLKIGLPGKNVNTVAPLLPMAYVGEYLGEERYLSVCREWAEWILRGFPRPLRDPRRRLPYAEPPLGDRRRSHAGRKPVPGGGRLHGEPAGVGGAVSRRGD